MSDINETIQESVDHARESKLNAHIAVLVAITATVMALCNVKDGNVVQAMQQVQADNIDAWNYYQAKSTKQTQAENTLVLIKLQHLPGSDSLITKYEGEITRYDAEKKEIQKQAEGYKKQYDAINMFDDQFDMTDALLSISIALFGITALTKKKWLFYFAAGVSILGIIYGLTAFMGISLHNDFVAKILS